MLSGIAFYFEFEPGVFPEKNPTNSFLWYYTILFSVWARRFPEKSDKFVPLVSYHFIFSLSQAFSCKIRQIRSYGIIAFYFQFEPGVFLQNPTNSFLWYYYRLFILVFSKGNTKNWTSSNSLEIILIVKINYCIHNIITKVVQYSVRYIFHEDIYFLLNYITIQKS